MNKGDQTIITNSGVRATAGSTADPTASNWNVRMFTERYAHTLPNMNALSTTLTNRPSVFKRFCGDIWVAASPRGKCYIPLRQER